MEELVPVAKIPRSEDAYISSNDIVSPHEPVHILYILSFFYIHIYACMSICVHLFVCVGTHVWPSAHAAQEW